MSRFKVVPLVKLNKYTIPLELNANLKTIKASLKQTGKALEESTAENVETVTEKAL